MALQQNQKIYTCVLIFKEMTNKINFQLITFSYAQFLKKLGATNISAKTKNKYELAYPIQKSTNVKFIEFSFSIIPEALETFTQKLHLDELLIRFFLTKSED
jgi:ribosomal protein S6|tara:strand:+ start:3756 stop:4061 length:306 start_codon:yes stop_codon:yes gene_type:complete